MYAEEHPEAEKVSEATQNFIDYLNSEEKFGDLNALQTYTILKLARLMVEEATGEAYL